jgi:integrase
VDYYQTVEFANLKPYSRSLYKQILEPLVEKHGHKPLRLLTREAAKGIIQKIGAERPGMANLTKGILARVFRIAVDSGQWHINPFARLTTYKIGTHHTWTDAELRAFEKRWPLGTRQRLAYALLLYTGQRVGAVVKMHRRDIVASAIHCAPHKTDVPLIIHIHPELHKAMKAYPTKGLTLFGDQHGKAVNRNSLTTFMRKAIASAGLDPRCKPHGLRKAALRRMAEGFASTKQMQAVSGHKTLKEIERYTEAANQPGLAKSGLKLVKGVSNDRKRSV